MTSEKEKEQGNGASSQASTKLTAIRVCYNHDTCMVSFDAGGAPMALLQMMLDEVQRQLEIMRRQAAALEFARAQNEARANAALADSILGAAGKRH